MPPKHASKPRAWGTRYDTLTSPPSSPPHSITQVSTDTSKSPTKLPHTNGDSLSHATADTAVPKPEKPRNDSSIFVGSLPSNVEHDELARMLTQHLSEHQEIVSIKAVSDKKGGVCAFIQCQDDEAAARLLDDLHSTNQRAFMGRYLRFELAHSFRTLLISYRAPPPQTFPNSGFDEEGLANGEEPPASAMRVIKFANARPLILWDTAALEYKAPEDVSSPDERTVVADLLLSPLKFDSEDLRKAAAALGPLEHFSNFKPQPAGIDAQDNIPRVSVHPHDAPRSSGMQEGIWEVKWELREDCAAALSALRRVPHLVVSWAHHQVPGFGQDSRYASPVTSPNSHSTFTRGYRQSQSFVQPPYMLGRVPSSPGLRLSMSVSANEALSSPMFRNWAPTYSSPQSRNCSRGGSDKQDSATITDATLVPDWSDDFPPLRDMDWTSPEAGKRDLMLSWSSQDARGQSPLVEQKASPSPASSLAVHPATPVSAEMLEFFDNINHDLPNCSAPTTDATDTAENPATDYGVASRTPVTPRTSASLPQTPQTTIPQLPEGDGPVAKVTPKRGSRFGFRGELSRDVSAEHDPMAIWVGALDTSRWGETRVRNIFNQYGEIERVDFHMRADALSFAFVRYKEPDASSRAVQGENERCYDGRPIRVQLKQVNPPGRGSPMRLRGRGRPKSYGAHRLQSEYSEIGSDASALDSSPRRATSQDPFRVSSRSPASTSRLSVVHPGDGSGSSTLPVAKQPSPESQSTNVSKGHPFTFDVHRDRPVSAGSSISPPPSSAGQSSAMSSTMQPYGYYPPPPWAPYPYGYGMPPYGMPYYQQPVQPQQYQANRDGSEQAGTAQTWGQMNQSYKPFPAYPTPGQGEGMYPQPAQHSNMQPPLHATGFYHNDHGALVPMYPPDALMNYQMAKGGQPTPSPPPQGPSQSQQQAQQPVPMQWYPPMAAYPYAYAQVAGPQGPGSMSAPPAMPYQMPGVWPTAPTGPPTAYMNQRPIQTQSATAPQATPPPHVSASTSASSVNTAASFGSPYPNPPTMSTYMPESVAPRHANMNQNNRRYSRHQGYQNRHSSNRFSRAGYPMEPSQSFVDPAMHRQQSQPPAPVRVSGSFPARLGSGV